MGVSGGPYVAGSHPRPWKTTSPPASGTSGTLAGRAELGDLLIDTTYGIMFVNEGTVASPYWTPVSYEQAGLWGAHTDFRDAVNGNKAVADTATGVVLPSGVRVFGDGIHETDSGLVVQAAAEGGIVGRLTSTNVDGELAAIGLDDLVMQPDQHQLLVVDVELTNVSAITTRAVFIGFSGAAADGMGEVATGATTTVTLGINDLAGILMDTGLTDAAGLMTIAETANAAGTQDLTAIGDTGSDMAAAGTYQRFRVEVDVDGTARAFLDKALLGVIGGATGAGTHAVTTAALPDDQETTPVVYISPNTTTALSIDIRRFATWAYR